MLDCGCNQNLDSTLLKIVETEAKNVDYILVSHASYIHVGALAYLTAKKI
jgi:Cft2 family RNA processing exonuclease